MTPEDKEKSFAELLEEDGRSPGGKNYFPGDTVRGRVVLIDDSTVFIDYGLKAEGWTEREEFLDEEGELKVAVGDEVELKLLEYSPSGSHLGTSLRKSSGAAGYAMLENSYEAGIPVEGVVKSVNKGGFDIDFSGARAFCPISQIDINYCEEPDAFVGTTHKFMVSEFEEDERNVVVSRRAVLEAEREGLRAVTLERLAVGENFDGVVTRILDFGAFVDIGGVEGLLHVSEISRGVVQHPADRLNTGDTVEVRVIKIEEDEKGRERIGLSMKVFETDPWEEGLPFADGDTVTGTVVRLAPFGAFVELVPGIDGLVHVSEISRRHVNHPKDELGEGDEVSVRILDIDHEKRRISLSIREALPSLEAAVSAEPSDEIRRGNVIRRTGKKQDEEPAQEAEHLKLNPEDAWAGVDAENKRVGESAAEDPDAEAVQVSVHPRIGLITKGIVNGIMPYGLFMDLPECGPKLRGLLHNSELEAGESPDPQKGVKEGDEMDVEIVRMDAEGKISLSRKTVLVRKEREELSHYMKKEKKGSMGTLADLLGKSGIKLK